MRAAGFLKEKVKHVLGIVDIYRVVGQAFHHLQFNLNQWP